MRIIRKNDLMLIGLLFFRCVEENYNRLRRRPFRKVLRDKDTYFHCPNPNPNCYAHCAALLTTEKVAR